MLINRHRTITPTVERKLEVLSRYVVRIELGKLLNSGRSVAHWTISNYRYLVLSVLSFGSED